MDRRHFLSLVGIGALAAKVLPQNSGASYKGDGTWATPSDDTAFLEAWFNGPEKSTILSDRHFNLLRPVRISNPSAVRQVYRCSFEGKMPDMTMFDIKQDLQTTWVNCNFQIPSNGTCMKVTEADKKMDMDIVDCSFDSEHSATAIYRPSSGMSLHGNVMHSRIAPMFAVGQ